MITDKRLQEIIAYHQRNIRAKWGESASEIKQLFADIVDECTELLRLRGLVKRLAEDGERLMTIVNLVSYTWIADGSENIVTRAINQHTALMKELEAEK